MIQTGLCESLQVLSDLPWYAPFGFHPKLLWSLQDIRLVDQNAAAVLAIEKELRMLTSHAYISFTGTESDCSAAVVRLQQALQVRLSLCSCCVCFMQLVSILSGACQVCT